LLCRQVLFLLAKADATETALVKQAIYVDTCSPILKLYTEITDLGKKSPIN